LEDKLKAPLQVTIARKIWLLSHCHIRFFMGDIICFSCAPPSFSKSVIENLNIPTVSEHPSFFHGVEAISITLIEYASKIKG
jgi:hypothetical protein